tara:strand:- start:379 stop:1200 length:822 start_codon:yes stop_codon:yes gene_type:complete
MNLIKKIFYTFFNFLNFFLSLKKNDNLLVTLPRSGTHLTIAMLNICYSIQRGYGKSFSAIDNGYKTFDNLDYPFDERSIFLNNNKKILWHSHMPYNKIVPLRKKYCKTIVLIREPKEGIKSYAIKILRDLKINFDNQLSYDKFLELDKKHNIISHYNNYFISWHKVKIKAKKYNYLNEPFIFDLDQVKKDKKTYLNFLNRFYNFEFTKDQIQSAVEQLDISHIKKKLSKNTVRFTNTSIIFSPEIDKIIDIKCKENYEKIKKLSDEKVLLNYV